MEEMEIEVYKSLLDVKNLMGIPKEILIYTVLIFIAVFVVTENFLVVPLLFVACFIEATVSRKDLRFIPIYVRKLERSNYFSS